MWDVGRFHLSTGTCGVSSQTNVSRKLLIMCFVCLCAQSTHAAVARPLVRQVPLREEEDEAFRNIHQHAWPVVVLTHPGTHEG